MSLKELKLADAADMGAEMQVMHPKTEEPMDAFISILGAESREYKRRQRAWAERLRKDPKNFKLLNAERSAKEDIIACVTGWRGEEFEDWMEYSPENARTILLDDNYNFICRQLETFMADISNFMPSNGKN
jgi:hypothetical protein